jgi:tripartite-type tricarboxylate transporter receptor subunit TctC
MMLPVKQQHSPTSTGDDPMNYGAPFLSRTLIAAAVLALPLTAAAQAFPSRPITIIVNFPPGGVTDAVARALAAEMGESLKQNVVVQNVAGAGGAIGANAIANAPKTGYSVGFVAAAALTTLPQLQPVTYRLDSFDYVCRTFDVPVYVLVAPDSPIRTLKDLVDAARASPDKITYATVGPGSLPHLAALDFTRAAAVSLNHVPYKGEGPAVTDLLGKHVDLYFGTSAVASTHNLRRLAVAADARVAESAETPTLTELGYPTTRAIMGGMIAPKGIDPQVLAVLRNACSAAVKTPAFATTLERLKVQPAYTDGAAFEQAIAAEAEVNRQTLQRAGLLIAK